MKLLRQITLALSLSITVAIMYGGGAGAQASGGIGGRPANPQADNPRTQSIFIFTMDEGKEQRDAVLVSNNSDTEQTIELYAVDGIVTNTGAYTCAQQSEAKQDVGSWVKLEESTVTLAPGESEEVGFSIAAPDGSDVGEHNGCLVFQTQDNDEQASGNVRIRTRQAIRIIATIPGDLNRSVEIADFTVENKSLEQVLQLTLENTGNVSADVEAKTYLRSLFGAVVYENGGGYPVLAGRQLDLAFVNEDRPLFGGWYHAGATISYDSRANVFGADDAEFIVQKTADRQLVFIAPTALGAMLIGLVAAAAIGAIVWLLKRRRQLVAARQSARHYTVKSGDSIQSVADEFGVDWKRLAKLNNLSAPYVLTAGQKIIVPKKQSKKAKLSKKS